nr:hypothetical protein StreXyl84_64720 [Streptomyces sp. Xyl84]
MQVGDQTTVICARCRARSHHRAGGLGQLRHDVDGPVLARFVERQDHGAGLVLPEVRRPSVRRSLPGERGQGGVLREGVGLVLPGAGVGGEGDRRHQYLFPGSDSHGP